MKILLFGGSGMLGSELRMIDESIIAPSSDRCCIENFKMVIDTIEHFRPDIVIHAAAMTDNRLVESDPFAAIQTNVIGTSNIALACIKYGARLVYISTDYVYRGDRGNYRETDDVKPFNLYSWTKLGGECSVVGVKNHLIIRTSFGKSKFEYKQAFVDKWSSKDYVDVIAPMIYEAATSPLTGVLNLGTDRKTLYGHATERSVGIQPVKMADTGHFTPPDTSLNLQKWIDFKSSESIAKTHSNCRVCGSGNMTKYLDLGLMPLANNLDFTAEAARAKERFPLQVMFCNDCGLSQLSLVINPSKMFSHYTYRSGVNGGYLKHCESMANELKVYGLDSNSFHIDIAGNDGSLLNEFRKVLGHEVLNVDPAANIAAISESRGIPTIVDFWNASLLDRIGRKADIITATNVFAHLDNVKGFIQACRLALKDNGILVIENPYLIDFVENMEFDTVYFEHVTYWSLWPMEKLCQENSMKVVNIAHKAIHGGTMRYIIARAESSFKPLEIVNETMKLEIAFGYNESAIYAQWSDSVNSLIADFKRNILALKKSGHSIAGFAASAKGNTLLNCAGITTDIMDYIIDQTPEKIGRFSPGTGIPIVGMEQIIKQSPDYIVILSWNFADEIMAKIRATGWLGKFIIPIPEWSVID